MRVFIRESSASYDKAGQILYYVDENNFVRKSVASHDKAGQILYYIDENNFVRKSVAPHDKTGQILYYIDENNFVRKSVASHDKAGQIVYYIDENNFVRKSVASHDKAGQIVFYLNVEVINNVPKLQNNNDNKSIVIVLAFVIGVLLAPIILSLGMFGKFILGGLFKNVLQIEEFKKFRKIFVPICLSWLGLCIVAVVLFIVFKIDVSICLYVIFGVNIGLIITSVVVGNNIFKKHKEEINIQDNGQLIINENKKDEIIVDEVENNNSVIMEELKDSEIIEQDNYDVNVSVDCIEVIKKLKELLDLGIITQNEFDKKKKELLKGISVSNNGVNNNDKSLKKRNKPQQLISKKTIHIINLILSFIGVVSLMTGITFLMFSRGNIDWYLINQEPFPTNFYFSYLHTAMDGEVCSLLTIISSATLLILLITQVILEIRNKEKLKTVILIDSFAIAFATVAIVFGFISLGRLYYYDDFYNGKSFVLVFSILVSVCCFFVLAHLIMTIIYSVFKKQNRLK